MNVKTIYTDYEDYSQGMTIEIDDEKAFGVFDGEPEDNNLSRNFCDCSKIVDLMELAWQAGKNGEDFCQAVVEINENN